MNLRDFQALEPQVDVSLATVMFRAFENLDGRICGGTIYSTFPAEAETFGDRQAT
jgi:hypothetical protein